MSLFSIARCPIFVESAPDPKGCGRRFAARMMRLLPVWLLLGSGLPGQAGNYPTAGGTQGFAYSNGTVPGGTWNDGTALNSTQTGTPPVPVASVQASALRLTADAVPNALASFKVPEIDAGLDVSALTVNFSLKLSSAGGVAGEGFSVNFGDIPPSDGDGELGWALPNGLVVGWKTYDDPAISEVEGEIVVYANRVVIARSPQTFPNDATFRPVTVRWDAQGLDVRWNNADIFLNLAVPGFAPGVGDRVAFSARTGPVATQEISIDSLQVLTTPLTNVVTGGPVISEFVAENKNTYEDEDLESPDWIELFNGSAVPAPMSGWFLTDDPALPSKWPLPAFTLGANQYRMVFASGKNRVVAAGQLHTSFTLPKTGGYLALVRPDLSIASEYVYGLQREDVAYGEIGAARERGFLEVPTPGKKNVSLVAAGPPAEEVVFSREGGLLANATPVTLAILPPAAPGAVVRYSLGQTLPTEISPVYTTPFSITASTTVRARVFLPGQLPGPVSSRTFLKLDATLTNYNGSGSVFSSNLPVLVMDSFGVSVDSTTDPAGARPFRPGYSVMLAPDGTSGRTKLDALPDFQGRCGTHVRGESSSGFGQKSYAWEIWNNENGDKDESVLGLPAESDWALHGPWSDKSMMRNYLVYSTFGEMHQDWFAPRVKFVEVFFNQEANQPVSYSDYRGVYLLVERIKNSSSRLGLEKTNPLVTDPLLVQGGYIFKKDKTSIGNTAWSTGQSIPLQGADPEVLSTAQRNYLQTYVNSFETALYGASSTNPVTGYAKWIDVPSFIDWQWAVEISKQIDGYVFSTYFHKDRGGKMKAGPLWDFNISLGNADYAEGEFRTGWDYDATRIAPLNGQLWFPQLHKDPNYRIATFDRYWQLRNAVWGTAAIQARIEAVSELLRDGNPTPVTNSTALSAQSPVMRHFRRHSVLGQRHWPNPADSLTRTTFQAEVAHLKQWITDRLAWADDQFLIGSTAMRPPVLTSVNAGNNTVQVSLAPFSMVQPGICYPAGEIRYTTDGSDPRPSGYALPVAQSVAVTLLTEYGQGSWFAPTAANGGSGLALTDWTTVTDPPNAASWTTGQLGFGFDTALSSSSNPTLYHVGGSHLNDNTWTGGTGNVQSAVFNNGAALMVRVPFTLTADQHTRLVSLKAKVRYDDGFVLFVNGVEAARQNILPASPAAWNATADATPGTFTDALGITGATVDISHVIGSLQPGTNMLAVLALNKTAADTDLLCVPSLTGSLAVKPTGANAPAVTSPVYTAPLVLASSAVVKARLFVPGTGQWGPLASSNYIVAAEPPTRESLVISEIHYAPLPPTPAEITAGAIEASDFEFLEFLNTGAVPLDLTGVRLSGAVQEFNFTNGDPASLTLPPGERLVVCGKLNAFRARYGNSARVAGTFTGNLNNAGEPILLVDRNGTILWSFAYDDQLPWPQLNGSGRSIVLCNAAQHPAPEPGLGTNWRPGALAGGDPGGSGTQPFTLVAGADDDGDGVPNLAEYAFGTDPANRSSNRGMTVAVDPPPPGFSPGIRLEIPVGPNADGLQVEIQGTATLGAWAAPVPAPVLVGTRVGADGQAVTLWEIPGSPAAQPRPGFFRVVVTKP